jgi:hypothetical protein
MATQKGTQRTRLILCGICFKADCPLSKWVTEGEPDSQLDEILDDLTNLWIEQQHSEMEVLAASRRTVEQTEAIEKAEEQKLSDVFGGEIKIDRETLTVEIITEKGTFLDDILQKYSEHVPAQQQTNQQQKQGH